MTLADKKQITEFRASIPSTNKTVDLYLEQELEEDIDKQSNDFHENYRNVNLIEKVLYQLMVNQE
jgi:hypothetical protein